jgi:hypothetical protein
MARARWWRRGRAEGHAPRSRDGYLAGLAGAGWAGDEHAVRFVFAATPWLKFEWLYGALTSGTLDAETEARWRGARPLIDRLGEEARQLASTA